MTTGLVVVHSALILTAFLVMLNGCLRGSAKAGIDAVLSVVWLGLLGAVLIIFGWQSAVLGLALSFVYAAGTRPIARSLARRMLGYRTTLSSDLTAQTDYSVAGMFRRGKETDERLLIIACRPDVAKVLAQNRLAAHDLVDQYWFMMAAGLGDLSWEIIASPTDLQRLLDLRRRGVPALEIAVQLMR